MVWRLKMGENGETTFIEPSGNFCFTNASIDPEIATDGRSISSDPYGTSSGSFKTTFDDESHAERNCALIDLFMIHINPVHQFIDGKTSPLTLTHLKLTWTLAGSALFNQMASHPSIRLINSWVT